MEKYAKWRDRSFQMDHGSVEKWVPEAVVDVIEGSGVFSQEILLSNGDSEKIKRGDIVYSTHAQAKAAAYEMVKTWVWNKWGIPEEKIQEY